MFKLVSEDRQRKSAVVQIVRKSVPSGRAGVAECKSSTLFLTLNLTLNDYFRHCAICVAPFALRRIQIALTGYLVNSNPDPGPY